MTVLLVLFTFALFLTIDYFRTRKGALRPTPGNPIEKKRDIPWTTNVAHVGGRM